MAQTSSPFEVQASTPTRFERRGLVRHGKRHLRKAEPQRYAAVRDRNGSGRARFRAAIERQECVAHARLDGDATTEAIRRADRLFRGDEAAVVDAVAASMPPAARLLAMKRVLP